MNTIFYSLKCSLLYLTRSFCTPTTNSTMCPKSQLVPPNCVVIIFLFSSRSKTKSVLTVVFNALFFRFPNSTISILTWMELFISAPTPMTKMSTFEFLRRRFLQTYSTIWRCSSGSSSPARSSSWRWTAWRREQKWTNREDDGSGRSLREREREDWIYEPQHFLCN